MTVSLRLCSSDVIYLMSAVQCCRAFLWLACCVSSERCAGENPALRCVTYELPLTALLVRPSPVPLPDMFFQAWPSLALGTVVS